ncbi:MAG: hypothetical protein ACRC8F_02015 [Cetobacterium sp.]
MSKFLTISKILWHGIKIVLHLTNKKDKVEKMEEVEKQFDKQ